jgi:hypothetical protein
MEDNVPGFRIAFRCTWIRLFEPFCYSFIIISIANVSYSNYYSESMTISSRITSDLRITSSTSSLVIQTFASRAVVLASYFQNRLFMGPFVNCRCGASWVSELKVNP